MKYMTEKKKLTGYSFIEKPVAETTAGLSLSSKPIFEYCELNLSGNL